MQFEAFGQSQTIRGWSEDPRCPVGQPGLIKLDSDVERAITEPPHEHLYEAFGVRKRLSEWRMWPPQPGSARDTKAP
jgi:hypothetical protein